MSDTGRFVWVDLSTFDVAEALRFYKAVFGWKYTDDGGYHFARKGWNARAGLFEMPGFLQEIDMPSFWMSYLTVVDIDDVVTRAKRHAGVVVEMEPFDFGDGRVALIRDPLGAGFTVYEGPDIDARGDGSKEGQFVWNDLFTADADAVTAFYADVVGLTVESASDGVHRMTNPAGEHVADLIVLDDDARAGKVFWMPYFAVGDLGRFVATVEANGGHISARSADQRGETAFCMDTQGATFAVVAV